MKRILTIFLLIIECWGPAFAQDTEEPLTWKTFDQEHYEEISLKILLNYD